MTELFEPLYKRTKKGGFVIWRVTWSNTNLSEVLITYGQVNGNPAETNRLFSSKMVAEKEMNKIRNKKKAEGLYHTLSELDIDEENDGYTWVDNHGRALMSADITKALDHQLPPLGSDPLPSKPPKKPLPEPHEIIDRNIPITIHLPRV